MIDADGEILGTYRKSHIPDGPGYEEKFYFRPGNTGFKVWDVRRHPHRRRHLLGPVVSRKRPGDGADGRRDAVLSHRDRLRAAAPDFDTHRMWRRAMVGHAVSNCMPVIAANRIGDEGGQRFYGHSFIANEWGDRVAEFGREESGALVVELDLAAARRTAPAWASSATAARSSTGASARTSRRLRPRRGAVCRPFAHDRAPNG